MDTIFHITGGLGKHVLFSGVINSYKNKYPDKKIIVCSAYPEIYDRNPNVEESLDLNKNQYFYKHYIYNKEIEFYGQEPYKQSSHINKSKHLIQTWCDMIGIEQTSKPTLHINFREAEMAFNLVQPHTNKPIIIFQPFGGPIVQQMKYCWARDIHPNYAQKIVNKLKDKYNIIHVCNPHHPNLEGVVRIEERLTPNVMFSLLGYSTHRILIDSSLQHAANAMGLPSTVFWVVTSPHQFGYPIHNNILPSKTMLEGTRNSYLFDYEITGIIPECPYFNHEEIISWEEIDNTISSF